MVVLIVIFLTLHMCDQVRLLANLDLSREQIKSMWLVWPQLELNPEVTPELNAITSDLQVWKAEVAWEESEMGSSCEQLNVILGEMAFYDYEHCYNIV